MLRKKTPVVKPEPVLVKAPVKNITAGTFYGVLPSDLVESVAIDPVYQSILDGVYEVVDALSKNKVNQRQAAVRLSQLRAKDERGVEWTVGSASLTWYRRVGGGSWISAHQPVLPAASAVVPVWYALTEEGGTSIAELEQDRIGEVSLVLPVEDFARTEAGQVNEVLGSVLNISDLLGMVDEGVIEQSLSQTPESVALDTNEALALENIDQAVSDQASSDQASSEQSDDDVFGDV